MKQKVKLNQKEKIQASDINKQNIVMIPIDKIKPCRWGTGIRDKEKFEQLKQNIKETGRLNNNPHVRPIGNGFFEPFIGDHRIKACKELGWKEILCVVDNISEQDAMERCVSDNTTHADYNPVQLEDVVSEMWNSGKYASKTQLGNKIGLSDTWVGLLIKAKVIRDKSKLSLDASIPSRFILDVNILQNDDEKIQLLKLVKNKIRKSSEIKEYAEFLSKASDERKKLVFQGVSLEKIGDYKPKTNLSKSRKITISTPTTDLSEIYKALDGLQDYIALIKDPEQKNEALNYLKFYTGLFLQILRNEKKIGTEFFESVVRHELKIDEDQLHHFDGLNTQGVSWWTKKVTSDGTSETDEKEETGRAVEI